MKYELNKPYNFEVKRVDDESGTLNFQVEIEGNLFPVKAYPEQLEESTPSIVSCRIMLDKNKNAFLVQNEAFLYPIIYKSNHRYLFEVAEIREGYVILLDKHGLYHTMVNDGTKLSLHEIIVRCVDVVKDDSIKAHLNFYYSEPELKKQKAVEISVNVPKEIVQTQYAPTIFEEDAPVNKEKNTVSSNDYPLTTNVIKVNATGDQKNANLETVSIAALLESKDWDLLRKFLKKHLGKSNTPAILKEISETISNYKSAFSYWEAVNFFIEYDAHTFLGTLAKIDTSKFIGITEKVDPDFLNEIIRKAFSVSDKLKHSMDLIEPCASYLTIENKNYIQSKCIELNTPESFYKLFKLLRLSPDDAIVYLLSIRDNNAAAYTIYKFYSDGKNGNRLSEKSTFSSFRPSKIFEYAQIMSKMQSTPFSLSSTLVKSLILNQGKCPTDLYREIEQKGYNGFNTYVIRKKNQEALIEKARILDSLTVGDTIERLVLIKQTDNYYILHSPLLGVYALLVKDLTKTIPNPDTKTSAKIAKILIHRKEKVFIVHQSNISSVYSFPPIVNEKTIIEIGFHETRVGKWRPDVKKFCNLIDAEIVSIPPHFDYRQKCKAQIIRRKDFFTYQVKILESGTQQ